MLQSYGILGFFWTSVNKKAMQKETLKSKLWCAGTLWVAVMQGTYHRADGQPRMHSILCTAVEVAHMHAHRIVHRDLTSRNVLLKHEPAIQRTRAKVAFRYRLYGGCRLLHGRHGVCSVLSADCLAKRGIVLVQQFYNRVK
jgi:hypothetical protein